MLLTDKKNTRRPVVDQFSNIDVAMHDATGLDERTSYGARTDTAASTVQSAHPEAKEAGSKPYPPESAYMTDFGGIAILRRLNSSKNTRNWAIS
jgi:hypothetical protein